MNKLLIPRYEVIADYPLSKQYFDVGQVLTYEGRGYTDGFDVKMHKDTVESFPHIFKKLNWWERRHIAEMPVYLKSLQFDEAYKIDHWDMEMQFGFIEGRIGCSLSLYEQKYGYEPINEDEYNQIRNESNIKFEATIKGVVSFCNRCKHKPKHKESIYCIDCLYEHRMSS